MAFVARRFDSLWQALRSVHFVSILLTCALVRAPVAPGLRDTQEAWGLARAPVFFAWPAWPLLRVALILCGRRGSRCVSCPFCVACVRLQGLFCVACVAFAVRRLDSVWQALDSVRLMRDLCGLCDTSEA